MENLLTIWKNELGIDRVEPLAREDFVNHHYAGYKAGEARPFCFLKATAKVNGYKQERDAADFLATLGYETQQLLGSGVADDKWKWLAFPWMDGATMRDEQVQPEDYVEAGSLLGTLHARTQGIVPAHIRPFSVYGELTRQLNNLKGLDETLYQDVLDRVQQLDLNEERCLAYEADLPRVLLHGDYGWRNVMRRNSDGRLVLIDFEHSAAGPIWMDFCKALDNELADTANYELFMQGYRSGMRDVPPMHPDYRWVMRLWMTAGYFCFALRYPEHSHLLEGGRRTLHEFDHR